MLKETIENFKSNHSGVDAFNLFSEECLQLTQSKPSIAAGVFFLYYIASQYVMRYSEDAIDVAFSEANKSRLLDYSYQLLEAYEGSKESSLEVLNKIVVDYLQNPLAEKY